MTLEELEELAEELPVPAPCGCCEIVMLCVAIRDGEASVEGITRPINYTLQ